ncbi:MAG: Trm112 family protein [Nitrospinae bacterium]|nr:Trm112 family protein [Nitrospinota bacterium]
MTISKELLDVLVCPQCRGDLQLTAGKDGLVCPKCRLLYEIKDEIPVMLVDEAVRLDENLKPLK